MKVINTYQCSDCLKEDDEYLDTEVKSILCNCGGIRHQKLHSGGSYFKIGKFRMDIDTSQWAKAHEKQGRKRES